MMVNSLRYIRKFLTQKFKLTVLGLVRTTRSLCLLKMNILIVTHLSLWAMSITLILQIIIWLWVSNQELITLLFCNGTLLLYTIKSNSLIFFWWRSSKRIILAHKCIERSSLVSYLQTPRSIILNQVNFTRSESYTFLNSKNR